MKRHFVIPLTAILLLPLLGVVTWYCISFLPHLSELKDTEKQGRTIVSSAPRILYKMALAAESKQSIRNYAIRQAYWDLGCKGKPSTTLSWHLNNAFWVVSSYLHFSEEQVFFVCSL
jgi:hypothetical protein